MLSFVSIAYGVVDGTSGEPMYHAAQSQSAAALALDSFSVASTDPYASGATSATSALLKAHGLCSPAGATPIHRLLVTDAPQQMAALAPAFLGETVDASGIELVDVIFDAS